MKAIWGLDYDFREDKCYERPSCPECAEPIGKVGDDDNYYCYSCGKKVEVDDPKMLEWFKIRRETKVGITDCFPEKVEMKNGEIIKLGCGGKQCVETHYMRNPITLKWQVMGGKCKNCGMEYIV